MGVFTEIDIEVPVKCCGRICYSWQSKRLTTISGDLQHTCKTIKSLEGIVSGEIHMWCGNCREMTQYEIKDGQVVRDGS